MRHLKLLILTLLLSVTRMAIAQTTFTSGNLNYSVNTDGTTVTVTGHVDGENATGPLTIPKTVTYGSTGYTVTAIGDYAFTSCHGFTGDLTIPNSVTTIKEKAFSGYYGFTGTLTLPKSLTTIKFHAFSDCTGFADIVSYAKTPPTLGNNVFDGWDTDNTMVYVPCGSGTAYGKNNWGGFSNLIEDCQVPTTVIPVESDAILLESGKWYTIDGRKQPGEPTQGGLYIHDGKIILFKP